MLDLSSFNLQQKQDKLKVDKVINIARMRMWMWMRNSSNWRNTQRSSMWLTHR